MIKEINMNVGIVWVHVLFSAEIFPEIDFAEISQHFCVLNDLV